MISIGRIVHYVLKDGQHRPAIVVGVWPNEFPDNIENKTGLNLQVFLDGWNDKAHAEGTPATMEGNSAPATKWIASAPYCSITSHAETWHWPEREDE
jgi:hypothetical protein